ncbi:asparagine synthase-related protein [Isoptericola aurantiacus]|uniref:asparagine synthase-related protein n=1 Tax=Isoptericola aurantiacus TaxID=3377839 RepID=UPI00383A8054
MPDLVESAEPGFVRLSTIEDTLGVVAGRDDAGPLPWAEPEPRAVLERVVAEHLAAGPAVVLFSGGRDSSALLAVAVSVARAQGMDEPIAVSVRHPEVPESDETDWQRLVVDHLDVHHEVIELHGEQSLLSETAQRAIRRRGVVWPTALQLREPVYKALDAAVLLTGEGGDHAFLPHRVTSLRNVLLNRGRPSRRLLRSAAWSVLPYAVQARRPGLPREDQSWLRAPYGRRRLQLMNTGTHERWRWDQATWRVFEPRAVSVVLANHEAGVREFGMAPATPFADPRFLAALARWGGRWGPAGRTDVMRRLFHDLLPDAVLARTSKAAFNGARWGGREEEFARSWDGTGVDPDVVDVEALRAAWLNPVLRSGTDHHLQTAWAASERLSTPLVDA